MASQIAQRQDSLAMPTERDENVQGDLNVTRAGLEISTVEKGVGERVSRLWVYRVNRIIANWYGMQLGTTHVGFRILICRPRTNTSPII